MILVIVNMGSILIMNLKIWQKKEIKQNWRDELEEQKNKHNITESEIQNYTARVFNKKSYDDIKERKIIRNQHS